MGGYRKTLFFILTVFIGYFFVYRYKYFDKFKKSIISFSFIIFLIYCASNFIYNDTSPYFSRNEIKEKVESNSLASLSKLFHENTKIGYFIITEDNRKELYYLFGEENNIYARLVLNWNQRENLSIINSLITNGKHDYFVIEKNDY